MCRGMYWECGSVIFSCINFLVSHVDNHVSGSYMCKSDTYFFFIQGFVLDKNVSRYVSYRDNCIASVSPKPF